MTYEFFYDVAEYLGEVNRGKPTARETAKAAFDYYCDWHMCLECHRINYGFQALIDTLKENENEGDEDAKDILEEINYSLKKWKLI